MESSVKASGSETPPAVHGRYRIRSFPGRSECASRLEGRDGFRTCGRGGRDGKACRPEALSSLNLQHVS